MKYLKIVILSLFMLQAQSSLLHAHAIRYELGSGGVVVQASFDDDQPAKGLAVAVFSPESQEKFQTGKTDRNGRFVFSPDKPGDWEMLVFDHMGHRLQVKIPVNKAMKAEENRKKGSLPLNTVIGVATLLILFGIMGRIRKKEFSDLSTYRAE